MGIINIDWQDVPFYIFEDSTPPLINILNIQKFPPAFQHKVEYLKLGDYSYNRCDF